MPMLRAVGATMDVDIAALVRTALDEDVGGGDVTTLATVDAEARAEALITQKAPGAIYGLDATEAVFTQLDPGARCERLVGEGVWREPGEHAHGGEGALALPVPRGGNAPPALPVLRVEGSTRALLTGERTALNFLGHLSGIATLTARYVEAVAGTGARILDTRKTTPGLRGLEKAAVAAGGGQNHRMGLDDAILIKENHIALAGGLARAVHAARTARPELAVEVECRNLDEVAYALGTGADLLLLDNMETATLRAAVELRDSSGGARAPSLEASGGVSLQTVRQIAESGVELISVGALTHSAPALDFSMLVKPT
jgi:nicotinate-nucleotide pyrophosphorylase (carboxylating)